MEKIKRDFGLYDIVYFVACMSVYSIQHTHTHTHTHTRRGVGGGEKEKNVCRCVHAFDTPWVITTQLNVTSRTP